MQARGKWTTDAEIEERKYTVIQLHHKICESTTLDNVALRRLRSLGTHSKPMSWDYTDKATIWSLNPISDIACWL